MTENDATKVARPVFVTDPLRVGSGLGSARRSGQPALELIFVLNKLMMDKRYQVFVSSTYADLVDERRRVIQTLMQMDCIPAGMELFPAADEEQWQFIKRVIDDCDYYVLIIGGRYGSTTPDGVSYTEKEYDYAIERGLKVLAFVHESPDDIPVGKSDIDPELRTRLEAFRTKVTAGRLVKFWKEAGDLPGLVALSLGHAMKVYPAVGWVRANQVASVDALSELNQLRKRNQELEEEAKPEQATLDLADLEERIDIDGVHYSGRGPREWRVNVTWAEVFAMIAPYLLEHPTDHSVQETLTTSLHERLGKLYRDHHPRMSDQQFQTIKIQLMTLGLINLELTETGSGSMALFWSLTTKGKAAMIQLRTVKKGAGLTDPGEPQTTST